MLPLLLSLQLLQATPTGAEAEKLAQQGAWDDLLLAASPVKPSGLDAKERSRFAAALEKGCHALLGKDAVLASSLGEKAVAFAPTPGGILCAAQAELATQQTDAAEKLLRDGAAKFPQHGELGLALGKALYGEHDLPGAKTALAEVPRRAHEFREAQALLKKMSADERAEEKSRKQADALERRVALGQGSGQRGGTTSGLTYESGEGPNGMRTRSNARFAFKYFNNDRDFGQRSDYEGRVAAALDVAHDFCAQILGRARESQTDVILYTKDEFALHFGKARAQVIAGLYSDNAIRINDAAELTQETQATLVHEYVHAFMDEVAGRKMHRLPTWMNEGIATYVEWRYLGFEGPPPLKQAALRGAELTHKLPTLESLTKGALVEGDNPALTYAESGAAVGLLMKRGGPEALLRLYQKVGQTGDFIRALNTEYSLSLEDLQRDLDDVLSRR